MPIISKDQQFICFIHRKLAFVHRVASRPQSSDPFPPQASQRLQVFWAWLLSYLEATDLLIRRKRRRSCSQWFSWWRRKWAREQLTKLLISERDFFFFILILLETFFFFGKWKAFWRSCTSSKPPCQRPESFLLNERWQNYRTQSEFVEGDLWSGIFPNHLGEDCPHRLPSSENY